MIKPIFILKIISKLVILFIFFTNLYSKPLHKYENAANISNYFSGILSISNNQYNSSYNFLKKLSGLEDYHQNFANVYISSLVKIGKFREAYRYAKNLELKNIDYFNSNLIIGTYYIKNKNLKKAKIYFEKNQKTENSIIFNKMISQVLNSWVNENKDIYLKNENNSNFFGAEFENIGKIQRAFFNCYIKNKKTEALFLELISDEKVNFSRYNFFYIKYLLSKGKNFEAEKRLFQALGDNPRNLMLNNLRVDLKNNNKNDKINYFDCSNISHSIAEFYYLISNLLSSQGLHSISNFYLSLAKFLNPNFISYETLYAENLLYNERYKEAHTLYEKIKEKGEIYNWHATKKLVAINLKKEKSDQKKIQALSSSFKLISNPTLYHRYDYVDLLRRYKNYEMSINQYSLILDSIDVSHELYSKTTDGRGIAYERSGKWQNAEKDFLSSLNKEPNQPYVINYLAYSWVEKGIKIEESLEMLRKANQLKKNDGYIIDSLGWALHKLKRYKEAKEYLQQAVTLMPSDPIVNDHYGDTLWMNGNKLQARYYWNYVLKLEETEEKLKETVKNKLINGIKQI